MSDDQSNNKKIPILDLQEQIQSHWEDLNAAFQRVLRSGQFILGPEVKAFEEECASYLGTRHAVGLNSGTDALFLAMRALGIGPGDEVIAPPFTFFATVEAISHVGATPVFADIEPDSFNINPAELARLITPRTKALIVVHLFGRPANMDAIIAVAKQFNLKVVEDAAQSFGADCLGTTAQGKAGTLGDIGCFSFFPTKNLAAFGDGGLLVTQDDSLAAEVRRLRSHGSARKYFNETVGYNSRLDELQAALLRVKLGHIDRWNGCRREVARAYGEMLAEVPGVVTPAVVDGHIFHQYTIRVPGGDRDGLSSRLKAEGIASMIYYPVPCHKLKIYEASHRAVACPIAEQAAREVLSLPIWPELTHQDQERVCKAIRQAIA